MSLSVLKEYNQTLSRIGGISIFGNSPYFRISESRKIGLNHVPDCYVLERFFNDHQDYFPIYTFLKNGKPMPITTQFLEYVVHCAKNGNFRAAHKKEDQEKFEYNYYQRQKIEEAVYDTSLTELKLLAGEGIGYSGNTTPGQGKEKAI